MPSGIEIEAKMRRAAIDRMIAASLHHAAPATEANIESWRNLSGGDPGKFVGQTATPEPEQSS